MICLLSTKIWQFKEGFFKRNSFYKETIDVRFETNLKLFLYLFLRNNLTVVDISNKNSFSTSGFLGDTLYEVSVRLNTKFPGVISDPVTIRTPEGSMFFILRIYVVKNSESTIFVINSSKK